MRIPVLAVLAASVPLLLGACGTTHEQQGEVIGGVLGGVLGAQVGDGTGRTAAIIVGTLAGSMIGRHIGQSMDETDRIRTARAFNDNRSGQVSSWVNPDNGNRYEVTPLSTYQGSKGPCREFVLGAEVNGRSRQEDQGTACLRPDGSWELF